MKAILLVMALAGGFAHGEDKTCQVKGMHCSDCAQMVKDRVCKGDTYTTCDVKVLDETKELGQVHLVTKDAKAKIDEKTLSSLIKDEGYNMTKCSKGTGKG